MWPILLRSGHHPLHTPSCLRPASRSARLQVHAIDDFGGYFRKEKETRADMDWYLQFNSSRSMDDAVASGQ